MPFINCFLELEQIKNITVMKKIFLVIILLVVVKFGIAQDISRVEATRAAANWAKAYGMHNTSVDTIMLEYYDDVLSLYIIKFKPTGFLILSSDRNAKPILAYSLKNSVSNRNRPLHYQAWLEGYSARIVNIIRTNNRNVNYQQEWEALLSGTYAIDSRSTSVVQPLLGSIAFGQSVGWNQFCPEDDSYDGHVPVGCVAVAGAQVMKKWNYPAIGKGQHQYYHDVYGNLGVSFEDEPYHWLEMSSANPDIYNAKLLFEVGVSVDMDYSSDGSGAYPHFFKDVFKEHFYYKNSMTYESRSNYTDNEWKNMLRMELDVERPVIYDGYTENYTAGHAFVCDGYDNTNKFHLNWGWGGTGNGYHDIDQISFSESQCVLIGIEPLSRDAAVLVKQHLMIDDDNNGQSSGNGNGLIEPGETIELKLDLLNVGYTTAHNITATIANTDNDISITNNTVSINQIPSAESVLSSPYILEVSPNCSDKDINISLNTNYNEGNTDTNFPIHVHGSTNCYTCPSYDVEIIPSGTWQNIASTMEAGGCRMFKVPVEARVSYSFATGCGVEGAAADFGPCNIEVLDEECNPLVESGDNCVEFMCYDNSLNHVYVKVKAYAPAHSGDFSLAYKKEEIAVSGVGISCFNAKMLVGSTRPLFATIAPSNATNQNVVWSSSNNSVATIDSQGLLSAVAPGNATITVTTEDGGYTATCNVTVANSFDVQMMTIVTKKAIGDSIALYINSPSSYQSGIWVDLNNNGIRDSNESVTVSTATKFYTINAQTIDIYGKIENFGCWYNKIIHLDISQNLNLKTFACDFNQITNLDLSQNVNLHTLSCDINPLYSIDLSQNIALKQLSCSANSLTSLDLSQNVVLEKLDCSENTITDLNLSQNIALKYLEINNLQISNIDLHNNTLLEKFHCNDTPITNIDLSNNISLQHLVCTNTNITSLDLTHNSTLQVLICNHNKITSLDVSANSSLSYLDCSSNQLNRLNVANGNNINFIYWDPWYIDPAFLAQNNPNLTCIQVDNGFNPDAQTGNGTEWVKDETAVWNNNSANPCVPVTGVTLNLSSVIMQTGETQQLIATVQPSDATFQNVIWSSSNNNVATVNTNGLVTAVAEGNATITVTTEDGDYTATCAVEVTTATIAVTGVNVSPSNISLEEDNIQQLSATISPANATNQNVSWSSSDNSIAIVDSNGLVTAVAVGNTTITVTTADGGYTATCAVEVTSATIAVTGVSVNLSNISLVEGDTQQLSATISPANATNQNVSWSSSDNSIAIVDANGLVTAVAAGNATIMVTTADGGYTATCAVEVTPATIAVTGVSVSPASTGIVEGENKQLTVIVYPSNATNQTVTWSSSDNNIATVNNNGLVSAVAVGNAIITVTTEDGEYTATCNVEVTSAVIAVTGVSVSPSNISLETGSTQQLTAIVSPSNASNSTVTWNSSNNAIATVNANGLVTAVAEGNATITVTTEDGGYTAICSIEVTPATIAVTGVSVSPSSISLVEGNTQQLSVTISPANATNQNVSWSSSNNAIATVNANGLVTAVEAGNATITVTTEDGAYTATCAVEVTTATIAVTGVNVTPVSVSLKPGETEQLKVTVLPANATNQNVSWSSSNANIATVNATGLVTAVAEGNATITVTTEDGGYTAICTVEAYDAIGEFNLGDLVNLYPNPIHDILHIEAEISITHLNVYDALGKQILSTSVTGNIHNIDVSKWERGIYSVELHFGKRTFTYKMLKQ